jgi:ABC-type uncharacterized transport system auxiliary subunit
MKRLVNRSSLLLAAALLGACFGGGAPTPEDHFYRLPEPVATAPAANPVVKTLAVAQLQTDSVHLDRAMLYVESTQALELRRYHYHLWVQPPTQLVQEQLMSYARAHKLAHTVVRERPGIAADAVIGGYLKRFERVIDSGAIQVDVELELRYQTADASKPALVGTYRRTVKAKDSSMYATVEAFGQALDDIFAAFFQQLG